MTTGQELWEAHLRAEGDRYREARRRGVWLGRQRTRATDKPSPYEYLAVHQTMMDGNDAEIGAHWFAPGRRD